MKKNNYPMSIKSIPTNRNTDLGNKNTKTRKSIPALYFKNQLYSKNKTKKYGKAIILEERMKLRWLEHVRSKK